MVGHWKAASPPWSARVAGGVATADTASAAGAGAAESATGEGSAQAASDTAARAAIRGRVERFMALLREKMSSEAQVPHRLAVAADQPQRLDADLDVVLHELGADDRIAGLGLDPFRDHRLVRDQQQRAAGNAVGEAGGEDGGGFHVD